VSSECADRPLFEPGTPTWKVIDLTVSKPARRAVNKLVFLGGLAVSGLDVNKRVGFGMCGDYRYLIGGQTYRLTVDIKSVYVNMTSFRET
jgi:hypothetical protein